MPYWIEVTGDYQFQLRLDGKIGLNAPMTNRYEHMLYHIKKGDIILHHITSSRSEIKGHNSAIVGISVVKNEMHPEGQKFIVDLEKTLKFPIPIKLKEYAHIKHPSKRFEYVLSFNLQKYILRIEKYDVSQIIELNKENSNLIRQNDVYDNLV